MPKVGTWNQTAGAFGTGGRQSGVDVEKCPRGGRRPCPSPPRNAGIREIGSQCHLPSRNCAVQLSKIGMHAYISADRHLPRSYQCGQKGRPSRNEATLASGRIFPSFSLRRLHAGAVRRGQLLFTHTPTHVQTSPACISAIARTARLLLVCVPVLAYAHVRKFRARN
jgi:hypothetical protein